MRRFAPKHDCRRFGPAPHQRGAAGLLAVLFMPVLLAALSAAAGLGDALLFRHRLGQAADFGALAAVQALDYEQLAQGTIMLLPGQAEAVARQYALANLDAGDGRISGLAIEVEVFNPSAGTRSDRVTGRMHGHATVCVRVSCSRAFRLGPMRLDYPVTAHADASAVPR